MPPIPLNNRPEILKLLYDSVLNCYQTPFEGISVYGIANPLSKNRIFVKLVNLVQILFEE